MRFRLVALVLAITSRGFAETDDPVNREADARFQEGKALFRQEKYDEARAKFAQALALENNVKILLNLGLAEKESGHTLDAYRHLRAYARAPKADAQKVERVQKDMLPALFDKIGHLSVKAPKGSEIRIDGERIGNAPLDEDVDVAAGSHQVEMRGSSTAARAVDARAGVKTDVTFDDEPHGASFVPPPPIAPPDRKPSGMRWVVGGALGAAGVGGVVLGIGFLVDAANASSDANRINAQLGAAPCPAVDPVQCASLATLRSRHENDAVAGGVFVAIGGAFVLGGIAAALLWPSAAPKRASITPVVGKDFVGASTLIRF